MTNNRRYEAHFDALNDKRIAEAQRPPTTLPPPAWGSQELHWVPRGESAPPVWAWISWPDRRAERIAAFAKAWNDRVVIVAWDGSGGAIDTVVWRNAVTHRSSSAGQRWCDAVRTAVRSSGDAVRQTPLPLLWKLGTLSRIDAPSEAPRGSQMAFYGVGPSTWVDKGQSVAWWYQFDGGADRGTQFASADIEISNPFNPGAILVADQQAKQVNSWEERVTYHVRITSVANGGAWHKLQGGGMV